MMGRTGRRQRTLMQEAYDAIKGRIISLQFRPGERLDERRLAAGVRVGRTPIREALFALHAEGLVEVLPNRGVSVRPLMLPDIRDLFQVLALIERFSARLAAPRITADELTALRGAQAEINRAIRARDHLGITYANSRFHRLIFASSGNAYLGRMYDLLNPQSQRLAYLCFSTEPRARASLREHFDQVRADHEAILRHLSRRDPDALEKAVLAHVQLFRERVQGLLETGEAEAFVLAPGLEG
jgi:DNA-binding GntR family transcriptional regulator